MGEHPLDEVARLLEGSSLNTPEARGLRSLTDDSVLARILGPSDLDGSRRHDTVDSSPSDGYADVTDSRRGPRWLVAHNLVARLVPEDLHAAGVYAAVAIGSFAAAVWVNSAVVLLALVLIPAAATAVMSREFLREVLLAKDRAGVERKAEEMLMRAEEVLTQEELAPRRWAARLTPEDLPDFPGFELGRVYQAGIGMMAGDFYDVFRVGAHRIAAVIGDVTGRGIEPSITAFQAKYLLRAFLRQYRDPAQALEELNAQMSALERGEEFISLVAAVFDTDAGTLRFSSAGHPAAWLWHDKGVKPLRATGPLLMLDSKSRYHSREIPLALGDLLLLYTDGLSEVRNGEQIFGEERIANTLRRDQHATPAILCKSLLEAARDFASDPMSDDIAIVAIRRT